MGNDSNEFKPTSVQEELNRAGAAAVDSSGIVPADNRDGDGKGLKSDGVREELKSGKDVAAAAALLNLSAGVNESEAASPEQQAIVPVSSTATTLNEPRRSQRLAALPSNLTNSGGAATASIGTVGGGSLDADTALAGAAGLSEEVSLWYED